MKADLDTFKPVLAVGDPIHFYFKIPALFFDTLHRKVTLDKGVRVSVKINLEENRSNTTDNVFFTDTTIFHVFDRYFETRIIKGAPENAYYFNGVLNNGFWEVETEYTTIMRGNYSAVIEIIELKSSAAETEEGVCMLGDPCFGLKLVWKQNDNNRIDVLFNDSKEKYPEYYGFIVE